mmetsp:Transcript_58231/g.131192  ORF Transcript_58231/g.131192 Transcript_58231/m.131192 type:complete len:166 (+) Transcript_58231:77-574(+)
MSRSRSPGGPEEKLRKLRAQIEEFVTDHKLDERVGRIMNNMHPVDLKRVLGTPFPTDCRNNTAFVISTIRKTEQEGGRPQGYRWDGRSWSEPKPRPKDGSRSRSPGRRGGGGGGGGRGARRDSRASSRSCSRGRRRRRDRSRSRRRRDKDRGRRRRRRSRSDSSR